MRTILLAPLLLAVAGCATSGPGPVQSATPPLGFQIAEGRNVNAFVREGPVAAHLLLRSGTDPRILVAFPAGNSGTGLWFERADRPVTWMLEANPRPVTQADSDGGALHGIEAIVTLDAPDLRVRQAVLSSVRVLRDYDLLKKAPGEVLVPAAIQQGALVWARDRLDGAPGYRLSIEPLGGARATANGFVAGPDGRLRLRIVALTGEAPLSSLGGTALLTSEAADNARARDALSFLSYEEKYLAGSWRFLTYFGRDTLMSLRLLMPVLEPVAVESGLGSVLARLSPEGEVAHEEDIGEFAVLRNQSEGRGRDPTPVYDYAMVDDDFMLAPVASAWLLDQPTGRARAAAFLSSDADGARQGDRLVRNLAWVVRASAAFADDPRVANLVAIKAGRLTGQWRDSEEGLGRGRYAYDVNAVFVPAALRAIARMEAAGLLSGYGSDDERRMLMRAARQAEIWETRAPSLFTATLSGSEARAHVERYARTLGVPAKAALAVLPGDPIAFNAIALDDAGRPIPIVHSDDGFALLFADPTPASLLRSVDAMMRPFPAGLMTDIGLLVANPVFATPEVQRRFGPNAYHGTVVWSWQQAVLAAGLDRQLTRDDLPLATRTALEAARRQLWTAIDAGGEVRTSELWSWAYRDGRYRVAPFGASDGDEDESNAAQLWSTVFLALRPPAP